MVDLDPNRADIGLVDLDPNKADIGLVDLDPNRADIGLVDLDPNRADNGSVAVNQDNIDQIFCGIPFLYVSNFFGFALNLFLRLDVTNRTRRKNYAKQRY